MRYKHQLNYSADHHHEMFKWCADNIGDYRINWQLSSHKIYFRFKRDYLFFLLRWA